MSSDERGYPCPCCGFLTLSENTHETFEICPICKWEDDDVQFNDPDYEYGANDESLNQARENYKKFGAKSLLHLKRVRAPLPEEIPPKTIPKLNFKRLPWLFFLFFFFYLVLYKMR